MTMTTPKEARPEWEPVAWFRYEGGLRIYYETKAWPDLTPLYGPAVHTEMLRAQEEARALREALERIRAALHAANEDRDGPINDTIWMLDGNETLFDAIDAALKGTP